MAEVKNNFVQSKMNQDLDDRLIPPGEYRSAQNISISRSEGSDVGALENILGNGLLSNLNLSYNNLEIIGQVTDPTMDNIYLFITDYVDSSANGISNFTPSTAKCFIYRINTSTVIATKLVEGYFLNFSKNSPISGANVLESLLFWTDNRNQPRKINVNTAALSSAYYNNEDKISVAKYAPITPIQLLDAAGDNLLSSTMTNPSQKYLDSAFVAVPVVDNPDYLLDWGGDPQYLQNRFVRFSYRFKFSDGEYSIIAPFTQICFIPKQQGYFSSTDGEDTYMSTVVAFMENNVAQMILNIVFPTDNPYTDLDISELDILYKESDAVVVKVIETIGISDILDVMASNANKNVYTFKYISTKPYRTLPSNQTTRVFDKIPIRAYAQEIISNRVVYGNYVDKNSPPESLNYGIAYAAKKNVNINNNLPYSQIEYPSSSLKQNRNYQVGIILADRFGRQSSVILSSRDSSVEDSNVLYGGSTIYVPYLKSGYGNALEFPGYALRTLFDTAVGSTTVIPTYGPEGYPGLYKDASYSVDNTEIVFGGSGTYVDGINVACDGGSGTGLSVDYTVNAGVVETVTINNPGTGYQDNDIVTIQNGGITGDATLKLIVASPNLLGWYSYKIVVRQTEQDYYNVYLPGILKGYPDNTSPAILPIPPDGKTSNIVLFNDNINKVPRDLSEVGPDQRQYRSAVQLFGRVEPVPPGGGIYNEQFYPGILSDTVVSISTLVDTNYKNNSTDLASDYPEFYQAGTNPLIARVSTQQPIGKEATNPPLDYNIVLGVYETNPVESLLDIYWETSSTGLVSELNETASLTYDGPSALKIGTPYTQSESDAIGHVVINNVSVVDSNGNDIDDIVFSLSSVKDGNGATITGWVLNSTAGTPASFNIETNKYFYYGSNSAVDISARNYTFIIDCNDVLNNNTVQLQLTGVLSNAPPIITNTIVGDSINIPVGDIDIYSFQGVNGMNAGSTLINQTQGLNWSIVKVELDGVDNNTTRGFIVSPSGSITNNTNTVTDLPYRVYIKLQDDGGLFVEYNFDVIFQDTELNTNFEVIFENNVQGSAISCQVEFQTALGNVLASWFIGGATNYSDYRNEIIPIPWPLDSDEMLINIVFNDLEIVTHLVDVTLHVSSNPAIEPPNSFFSELFPPVLQYNYTVQNVSTYNPVSFKLEILINDAV